MIEYLTHSFGSITKCSFSELLFSRGTYSKSFPLSTTSPHASRGLSLQQHAHIFLVINYLNFLAPGKPPKGKGI